METTTPTKWVQLAGVFLLVGLLGCDSKTATSPSSPTMSTGAVAGNVSTEAGGVVGDAAGACVTVPPGAVERETRIEIASKPAETYVTPAVRVIGQVWSFRVDGQERFTFAKPVRVAVPFDPALATEGAPVSLSVWQDGRWQNVPGARADAASRQVVADVDHFSDYAPTQDGPGNVIDNALEGARKRFLHNQFWYGSVHLAIHGSGRQGKSSWSISREAEIRFRVRAKKEELATFAGFDELKKRGVRLPPDSEAAMEQLRNIRHWTVDRTNRDPEDETELHWSVDDRWDEPGMSRTVKGGNGGKYMALPGVFADVVKGEYSFWVGIESGTIVRTETPSGGTPKSTTAPAMVSWTRHGGLPAQGNLLAGRDSGKLLAANIGDGGVWTFGYGTIEATMTWTLSPEPLEDVELVLVPEGYEDWMPEGGRDESTVGNTIPMKAVLRHRGGGAAKARMTDIVVRLADASTEPGVCLNLPRDGGGNTPDLKFAAKSDGIVNKAGTEVTRTGKFDSVSFSVDSYDWGAWGRVTAVGTLTDGRLVWATLDGDGSMEGARLPKRDRDSRIADAWKKRPEIAAGDGADTHDLDEQTGNANDGDGLTLYEEYRGLISKGRHTRHHAAGKDGFKPLTPGRKDLVVHNTMEEGKAHELLPAVRKGLVLFQKASEIHVVEVRRDELTESRQVNLNRSKAVSAGEQFGLRMFDDPALTDPGQTTGGGGALRGPDLSRSPMGFPTVKLNLNLIKSNYAQVAANCRVMGVPVPYTLEESAANTAAHELAHGLGVKHHGEDRPVTLANPQKLTVYDRNGNVIPAPVTLTDVGEPHNTASGDVNCIMCYNNIWTWCYHSPDALYAAPLLAEGTIFCTVRGGATGVNLPRMSGDGKRKLPGVFDTADGGDCLGQMRVRDMAR